MSRSLVDELKILIKDTANNNPAPKICTISDVYPDGNVDVKVSIGGVDSTIMYRPCIGDPRVDDEAVIVFIDGNINGGYVICSGGGGYDSSIGSSFNVEVVNGVLTVVGTDLTPVLSFVGLTADEVIIDEYEFTAPDDCFDFGMVGAFDVTVRVGGRHAHCIIENGVLASRNVVESDSLLLSLEDNVLSVESDDNAVFEVFGVSLDGVILLGEKTVPPVAGECELELDCLNDGAYNVTVRTPYKHGHMVIL